MLHKFFSCASVLCLLALTLALLGCSGSGSPLIPEIQEITIVSPITGSEWGSPQGVWEVVFLPISWSNNTADVVSYQIIIDDNPVVVVATHQSNDKGTLAHVIVPDLEPGEHHLKVEAILITHVVAKGQIIFIVRPERGLTIELTEPNAAIVWTIEEMAEINWAISGEGGDLIDSFQVYFSHSDDIWEMIGELSGASRSFLWVVPVVDHPGQLKFAVKINALLDGHVIASGESHKFIVDYGGVAKVVLNSNMGTVNTPFTISATVYDSWDNPITNYGGGVIMFETGGILIPETLGDGSTTGTWNDGTVSFDGYIVDTNPIGCLMMLTIPYLIEKSIGSVLLIWNDNYPTFFDVSASANFIIVDM